MFLPFWVAAVIISFTTFSDDARNKRDIVWGKHTEGFHGLMPCFDYLLSYWTYNYELHWSVDITIEKSVYCLIAFEYAVFFWKVENVSKIGWVCLLFGICFLLWKCTNLLKLFFLYIRMMVSTNVTVLFGFVGQVLDLKRNLGINVMNEIKKWNNRVHY